MAQFQQGAWRGRTVWFAPDEILVGVKRDAQMDPLEVNNDDVQRHFQRVIDALPSGTGLKHPPLGAWSTISLPPGSNVLQVLKDLEEQARQDSDLDDSLRYAEPNFKVEGAAGTEPAVDKQPVYDYFTSSHPPNWDGWQWGLDDMKLPEAWYLQKGNTGVFIGIVDTGIWHSPYPTSDVAGPVIIHRDLDPSRAYYGGNFWSGDTADGHFDTAYDEKMQDGHGHGTGMTGIITAFASTDPSVDGEDTLVAGINWFSPFGACKSLNDNKNGTVSTVYQGVHQILQWTRTEELLAVINLSLVISEEPLHADSDECPPLLSESYRDMCDTAKAYQALLVCAAGTHKTCLGEPAAWKAEFPDTVLAVGETSMDGGVEKSVESAQENVSILAPGYGWCLLHIQHDVAIGLGSSISAAIVSGIASLLRSHAPTATTKELITALDDSGQFAEIWNAKRVRAYEALLAVEERAVAAFVVDRSGSMSRPSGTPGKSRADVLADVADVMLTALEPRSYVGVVSFSDTANDEEEMTEISASSPDVTRDQMHTVIDDLVPGGYTSIGAGLTVGGEMVNDTPFPAVEGLARPVLFLLTDGRENRPPWVRDPSEGPRFDFADLEGVPVYAIGCGTPDAVDVETLRVIAEGSGGDYRVAGEWDSDAEHEISRLLVEHLATLLEEEIVEQFQDVLEMGGGTEAEFLVTPLDRRVDVLLLADNTRDVTLRLVAPDGTELTVNHAETRPGIQYEESARARIFRLSLPLLMDDGSFVQEGPWKAVVQVSRSGRRGRTPVPVRGIIKAKSRLRTTSEWNQTGTDPGSSATFRTTFRAVGVPRSEPWEIQEAWVEVTDPQGKKKETKAKIHGEEVTAKIELPGSGAYRCRVVVHGEAAGHPFRRERILTPAVWNPADAIDEDDRRGVRSGSQPRF